MNTKDFSDLNALVNKVEVVKQRKTTYDDAYGRMRTDASELTKMEGYPDSIDEESLEIIDEVLSICALK